MPLDLIRWYQLTLIVKMRPSECIVVHNSFQPLSLVSNTLKRKDDLKSLNQEMELPNRSGNLGVENT